MPEGDRFVFEGMVESGADGLIAGRILPTALESQIHFEIEEENVESLLFTTRPESIQTGAWTLLVKMWRPWVFATKHRVGSFLTHLNPYEESQALP